MAPRIAIEKSDDEALGTIQTALKTYSKADISASNLPLIIIEGAVYDISPMMAQGRHPGGIAVLNEVLRSDATDQFMNSHPIWTRQLLSQYKVGDVSDWIVSDADADFRKIRADLEASGAFSTGSSSLYYCKSFSRIFALAAIALGALALSTSTIVHIAIGAVALGLFWQQIAFVGHDLGHNGVSGSLEIDSLRGLLIGPALTGISFSWWKSTHNAHHIATNSATGDPDVQHTPLLALSTHFFESLWSTFHKKRMGFGSIARLVVSHQHLFFYPLMFFARWNLYFQGWCKLFLEPKTKWAAAESMAIIFFWTWVLGLTFAVGRTESTFLAAFPARLLFLITSNGVAGILNVQISLSHFAEPTIRGRATDSGVSFLEAQLRGTMNITVPPELDYTFGGLQFQIEHHLFPRLPAEKLRSVQPLIRGLAEKHGITYKTMTFVEANVKLFESLQEIAASAYKLDGKVLDQRVIDAIMLRA